MQGLSQHCRAKRRAPEYRRLYYAEMRRATRAACRHVRTKYLVALCAVPGVTMGLALTALSRGLTNVFEGAIGGDVWHRPARRQPPSFIQSEYTPRIAAQL